jgi:acyl dehydratase
MNREVTFTEDDVQEWCEQNADPNPIHTDEDAAEDSTFGQRVVPGMMLMDQLSGMLTALGDEGEEVILSGITAARFRDPVLLDETVAFNVEIVEEDKRFTAVDFEARVEERGSLVANGTINVVIN